jgi:hypothetical protein
LVHELIEAKDEKRLMRYQKQMAAHQLLIVDELAPFCSAPLVYFPPLLIEGISADAQLALPSLLLH